MKPTLITNLETGKQNLATNLTSIAALDATAGLVEQTGAGAFTKRLIGTSNATDILTKGGADGLYSLSAHNHNGTYQPLDADLTAIAALAGTTGILRKTAADTWSLDTAAYSLSSHNHDGTYQPLATTLTDLAALTYTSNAGKAIIVNGTNNGVTFSSSPLGTAAFSAATAFLASTEKGSANGLATLGADSKIPTSQLPALAITSTFVAANQTAHLAVSAQEGDVVVRTDLNKSYIHNGGAAGSMADWQELLTPTDTVTSVNGYTGAVSLTKSDIGLTNVDNTSDADKPVSSATQTALDGKLSLSGGTLTAAVPTLIFKSTANGSAAKGAIEFKTSGNFPIASLGAYNEDNNNFEIVSLERLRLYGQSGIDLETGLGPVTIIQRPNTDTGLVIESKTTTKSFVHFYQADVYRGWVGFDPANGLNLDGVAGAFLSHSGAVKLGTTAAGISVTGTLSATGAISGPNLSGTNTGDQTITLTGDVTGSGTGSFAATVANSAITLAKMANVASGTVFYRKTAATGAPEVQTLATLKTDLGLTGTNTGDQTITLTGDVTGSGDKTFAATLATVNSNTGSFGSATAVPSITVNAKGLITAVSTNVITPAGIGAIPASEKGTANGVATLGADSKIPTSQLPALAITSTTVAANQTAHLAVVAQEGDVVVRTDLNKSYIHNGGSAGTMADWQELLTPTDTVTSVNGYTGVVSLTKTDIGLANVDNTSDANKPVSSAQQTALNLKANLSGATFSGAISATNLSGTNTGDQTITLTGDVTGSGTGSFAATVANKAVTLAKMADVATGTVFYRKTAATGVPEVQTLATLKTDLGLTGTNSGDQTITLTGPVTGSGTGSFATSITNNAVTNAMLAQVATATFLGRATAATGNVETLTAAQATQLLDPFTGTTKGLVPNPTSSSGRFLKDDGTWATISVQAGWAPVTAVGTGASQGVTLPESGLLPQDVLVFVNGSRWNISEYSIAGTTLTLTTNASGDTIEIIKPAGATGPQGPAGSGGGSSAWGGITGTLSDQTDLQSALDAKLNSSTVSAFGQTLIDDADAEAARATLGLGTAAVYNTGNSGGVIPFLSGSNTWSSINSFTARVTTAAPTAAGSGFRLAHGTAPTSPSNGDLFSTTAALSFHLNGATKTIAFIDSNITGSAATLTTGRTISTTGDVAYTSGSFDGSTNVTGTATIATGAVTLAKMADVATGTVFYRKTAATGAPEVQTLATLKTDLGLTGTNSGDETYSTITTKLAGGSGGGTTNFLRADGTFAAPPGGGGAAWGGITGTLSNQTDLQTVLDTKAPVASPTFTGTVMSQNLNTVEGLIIGNGYVEYRTGGVAGTWQGSQFATGQKITYNADNGVEFRNGAGTTTFGTLNSATAAFLGTVTGSNLSGTNTGDQTTITGNAGSATVLQTSRNFSISGGGITAAAVGFNGSANATLSASVDAGHITLARMANLAANSIIGNNTGSAATPIALTAAQVRTLINVADGATANTGTVTAIGVTTANGVSGTSSGGATPNLTITLGAITPTSVVSSGAISGTTGTFTGNITAPNFQTNYAGFCSGVPAASEVVLGAIAAVSFTMSQTNTIAKSTVAATASTVFTIAKDGSTVGTITFAPAATTGTISITSGAITANQNITVTAPATPDSTLANISFLLRA